MISNTNSNKLKSIESNISLPVLSPLSPSPTPTKLPSQTPIYIPTDAPVNQHKRKATTVPTLKPKRSANTAVNTELPSELGKLVHRDVALLKQLGWTKFVQHRRRRGDFASLDDVHHPAKRLLLRHYKNHGAPPVKFSKAMDPRPHQTSFGTWPPQILPRVLGIPSRRIRRHDQQATVGYPTSF